jgi:hypothetical protein
MPTTKIEGVPSLQRERAILEYLATHNRSATITEFPERLDYPTATVYRITIALEAMCYLSRDPATKRFSLTNQLLLLGQPQGRDRWLVETAIPAMRELREVTGDYCRARAKLNQEALRELSVTDARNAEEESGNTSLTKARHIMLIDGFTFTHARYS